MRARLTSDEHERTTRFRTPALTSACRIVMARPSAHVGGQKEKGGPWPPSRRPVSAIAVYAAVLTAAVGSPANVARSDRSTTVAISRRRSNLSHRAYTAGQFAP